MKKQVRGEKFIPDYSDRHFASCFEDGICNLSETSFQRAVVINPRRVYERKEDLLAAAAAIGVIQRPKRTLTIS